MTTKNTKIVLLTGLIAAMIIPFSGIMMAEASVVRSTIEPNIMSGTMITETIYPTADSISAPVRDGINTGLKLQWNFSVDHTRNSIESRADTNICGQKFFVNGFYDTKYNKRGLSYQFPSTINGLCNIDRDLSGYVNLQLDRVEYKLQGDGNRSKSGTESNTSWYKFFNDGFSNSGKEYVQITAYYNHIA